MSLSVGIEFIANTRKALQAVDNFRDKVAKTADKIADSTSMKVMSGAALADTVIRFKNAISDIFQLGDFAKRFNLPIETVSKFAGAVELLGGNTEEALDFMGRMRKAVADLRTEGKGDFFDIAPRVRMNLGAVGKDFRSTMNEFRRVYAQLGENGKIKFRERFGLTSPAMIKLLESTNAEYERLMKTSEEIGTVSASTYEKLDKTRELISGLKLRFSRAAMQILSDMNPVIEKLNNLLEAYSKLPQTTRKGIIYGIFFAGLSPLMLKLLPLLLSPAGLAGSALLGGGYLAYTNWESITKGWDWLVEKFENGWTRIFNTLDWVNAQWNGAVKGLMDSWDWLVEKFENAFTTIFEWVDKIKGLIGLGKEEIKPVSQSKPYLQYAQSTMQSNDTKNGWLSNLISGNTFNVNIVGSANPFEMSQALEQGIMNSVGSVR